MCMYERRCTSIAANLCLNDSWCTDIFLPMTLPVTLHEIFYRLCAKFPEMLHQVADSIDIPEIYNACMKEDAQALPLACA